MSKKLAYLVSQFPSFSETFIQREVSQLSEEGYDLHIYSLKTPKEVESEINIDDAEWLDNCIYSSLLSTPIIKSIMKSVILFRLSPIIVLIQVLWQLRRTPIEAVKIIVIFPKVLHYSALIHDSEISHIHAHWATVPTTVAYMISKIIDDISYSFTGHAWDLHSDNTNPKFLKGKIHESEYVISCTKYNVDKLNERADDNTPIYLNYHGVQPEGYKNTRERSEQTYFVAGGRFVEKKGFGDLVRSLARVREEKGYEIPTILFGDGPLRENVERLADDQGLEKVYFVGRIEHDQVKKYLSNAQAFVAPSVVAENGDIDGIPNVILESFASATPVIGSNLSGIPEAVKHNETGWLIEPGSARDLSKCCIEAWESPKRCDDLGKNGRELVEENFDITNNINEYINIVENEL
ncbi:glycosyltransferase family 4 protein [Natrialba sp. SSL1]|uniref:glycosyltransferase family 4 protein n=1 Tax=Natrialba sp. SSL1 TaxID=1869245 RepID=UPI000A05E8A9|nr:glycosyltransferase family 4 protein [Natrialba sp. SSL1]